jgi:hypothetical protein
MTAHNYKSSRAWTGIFLDSDWIREPSKHARIKASRGHGGYRNKFRSAWPAYLGFCLKHSLIPRASWVSGTHPSPQQEKWFSMASFLARPSPAARVSVCKRKINAKTSPCSLAYSTYVSAANCVCVYCWAIYFCRSVLELLTNLLQLKHTCFDICWTREDYKSWQW